MSQYILHTANVGLDVIYVCWNDNRNSNALIRSFDGSCISYHLMIVCVYTWQGLFPAGFTGFTASRAREGGSEVVDGGLVVAILVPDSLWHLADPKNMCVSMATCSPLLDTPQYGSCYTPVYISPSLPVC